MDIIQNILVATDCSSSSAPVMKISGMLSEKFNGHLSFLNIVEERLLNPFKIFQPRLMDEMTKRSEHTLTEAIRENGLDRLDHTAEVSTGEPFVEILNKSTSAPPAGLIVIGGGGDGGGHKLGKNAFKILQMGSSHTLVMREGGQNGFKKILLAMDFSEHAYLALEYALLYKSIFGAKLKVFQVVPGENGTNGDGARKRLQERLPKEQFDAIDGVEVKHSPNPAQEEIVRKIEEDGIDLLVIGSHGKAKFIRNIFLGKVAYDVVRKVNCSILVLKMPPLVYTPPDVSDQKGYL
jgi:nucleotide-binding universal stress UspA family protein